MPPTSEPLAPARTKKQFLLFALVGGGQYLLDAAVLYILLVMGMEIVSANIISRVIVGLLGFGANRYVTFAGTQTGLLGSFGRFLVAWLLTSVLSTLGILAALSLFTEGNYSPELGVVIKLGVEALVFFIAFLIQKFWIFDH